METSHASPQTVCTDSDLYTLLLHNYSLWSLKLQVQNSGCAHEHVHITWELFILQLSCCRFPLDRRGLHPLSSVRGTLGGHVMSMTSAVSVLYCGIRLIFDVTNCYKCRRHYCAIVHKMDLYLCSCSSRDDVIVYQAIYRNA